MKASRINQDTNITVRSSPPLDHENDSLASLQEDGSGQSYQYQFLSLDLTPGRQRVEPVPNRSPEVRLYHVEPSKPIFASGGLLWGIDGSSTEREEAVVEGSTVLSQELTRL